MDEKDELIDILIDERDDLYRRLMIEKRKTKRLENKVRKLEKEIAKEGR